jgi:hypothetical protein
MGGRGIGKEDKRGERNCSLRKMNIESATRRN